MHCLLNALSFKLVNCLDVFHTRKFILLLALLGLFTGGNDKFPHPFKYLKPDDGTHFGRSLHV